MRPEEAQAFRNDLRRHLQDSSKSYETQTELEGLLGELEVPSGLLLLNSELGDANDYLRSRIRLLGGRDTSLAYETLKEDVIGSWRTLREKYASQRVGIIQGDIATDEIEVIISAWIDKAQAASAFIDRYLDDDADVVDEDAGES